MQGIKLKVRIVDDGWFSNANIDYLYMQFNTAPNPSDSYITIYGSRTKTTATQFVVV